MKRIILGAFVFVIALTMTTGVALANWVDDEKIVKLSGPHWQFNIIGHPKNVDVLGYDHGNGRAIMVPLKTVKDHEKNEVLACLDTYENYVKDEGPIYDMEPMGAKIYFESGHTFAVLDRDATDKDGARIMIPTKPGQNPLYEQDMCSTCGDNSIDDLQNDLDEYDFCVAKYCSDFEEVTAVDVWIRVLGKPDTCMDINGFAEDAFQELYFLAGRIELARKRGMSYVRVNDIFDVNWCEVDGNGNCIPETDTELSVFNDVFASFFWDGLNWKTRNVQVRLYPVKNTQQ